MSIINKHYPLFVKWFFGGLFLCMVGLISPQSITMDNDPEKDLDAVDSATRAFEPSWIKTLDIPILENPPTIDGDLSDKFWAKSKLLKIKLEFYPIRFSDAVVDTDALIGMTHSHVYFAINAYDPDISQLRTAVREHDGIKNDDYVSVVIDPAGNLRRKYEFRVNPSGSTSDVLQNTISDRYIYDWDTQWQAAAKIIDSGYLVEIAIPIDSLKQPLVGLNELNTWTLIIKRSYPRGVARTMGSVYIIHPPNPSIKPAQQKNLSPHAPIGEVFRQKKTFDLNTYAIMHPKQTRDYGESFSQEEGLNVFDAGLDASITIANATKFALTLNPNYTDVLRESINNPFTLFQPEKRKFFQDNMDLYSTLQPLVYTRNYIKPTFGMSLSHEGTLASHNASWVSDQQTSLIMPDNLGSAEVALTDYTNETGTLRYITANKGSAYGLLSTYRSGQDYNNTVFSSDGLINMGLDDKLRYQLSYAKTDYTPRFANDLCEVEGCTDPPPAEECLLGTCDINSYVLRADPTKILQDYAVQVQYKHSGPKTLFWINYFDVGKDFRADLGFIKRVDYRFLNLTYGRNWYFNFFNRDQGQSRGRVYLVLNNLSSQAGEQIEKSGDIWAEFRGSFQTVFRTGIRVKEKAVNRINQANLALGDNAPLFDERYVQWYFKSAPFKQISFDLDGRYGDIADADNLVLGKMIEFKPRIIFSYQGLQLNVAHIYRQFQVDNSQLYSENFSTLTLARRVSNKVSNRLLIKYDNTERDTTRFLGDVLSFERSTQIEFTHIREFSKQIMILTGAKIGRGHDAEFNQIFTHQKEAYIRVNYNFEKDFL